MAIRVADNSSIDPRAEIDDGVEIGPCCVVGPNVRIREGTRIEGNVTLLGHVEIGRRNHIFPSGCFIGGDPQDTSYRGTKPRASSLETTTSSASA